MSIRAKQLALLIGDIILLYGVLFLMLLIRYGTVSEALVSAHLGPFSWVFILWIAVFYVGGLYDIRGLKDRIQIVQELIIAIVSAATLSVVVFYLVPYFFITPKTNLVIFSVLLGIAELGWRFLFRYATKTPQRIALMLGDNEDITEMHKFVFENPQFGYKIAHHIANPSEVDPELFDTVVREKGINTIITTQHITPSDALFDKIYRRISDGMELVDFTTLYETLFKKVPLSEIKHMWVLSSISRQRKLYDTLRRPIEFVLALIASIILLIPLWIVWLFVVITSKGPGIYRQTRIGRNDKPFALYKFRTMREDAEKDGAQWAQQNDPRTTPLGKLLRRTHIDELPQLINILTGSISFVGPRPERPTFIKSLEEAVPYYEVRHLIKPGLTGWAQVNYRYGASLEDAHKKLQYDIYYIKHRSFLLDFFVFLRTIKMFVFNHK